MNWIRKLFGLCEHKWKHILPERLYASPPSYTYYIIKCEKCGDVKLKQV